MLSLITGNTFCDERSSHEQETFKPYARLLIFTWCAWAQNYRPGAARSEPATHAAGPAVPPPNILFIIMDDVGIDQLRSFGYGGPDAPRTPNLDAIGFRRAAFP